MILSRINCLQYELKNRYPDAQILEIHLNEPAFRLFEEEMVLQCRYAIHSIANKHLKLGDIIVKCIQPKEAV